MKLVGTDFDKIVGETTVLLQNPEYYSSMSNAVNPYGDGFACERILQVLIHQTAK